MMINYLSPHKQTDRLSQPLRDCEQTFTINVKWLDYYYSSFQPMGSYAYIHLSPVFNLL